MATKVIVLIVLCGVAHSISVFGQGDNAERQQGRFFFGGFPSFPNPFGCIPFNRTFVQTGVPCMRRSMTAVNCRNQTCVCTGITLPTFPGAGGGGSDESERPIFPPFQIPFSFWNCSASTQRPISPTTTTPGSTTTGSTPVTP